MTEIEMAAVNIQAAAESMRQSANAIADAAEKIRQSMRDLDFTLSHHQKFLTRFLEDLELAVENSLPSDLRGPVKVQIVAPETQRSNSERPTDRCCAPDEEIAFD